MDFFGQIGQSLPIRRSFRSWLSEKLFIENDEIRTFIEEVLDNDDLESFWKDEIIISILLSDYSDSFFETYKAELLAENQDLIKRIRFLLQIACKEADVSLLNQLGLKPTDLSVLKYISTKPKGKGWESFIKFILDNIESFGIENIGFALAIIHDWNSSYKDGETTKRSGQIALKYYQWTIKEDIYSYSDKTRDSLIKTIIFASSELKTELKTIFQEIIDNRWKNHQDPYYDLSKTILTKIEGITAATLFPKYIFKLAELFWFYTPVENPYGRIKGIDTEQYFGLESIRFDYYPASAYQTPVFWLLQNSLKETVDFILEFTDKVVEIYKNSSFDSSIEVIDINLNDEKKQQYISNCLWNLYRGTGSPVSPYLLQSIHMALEKFFLENGKNVDAEILESWLFYLLKNTKSASITSVVSSIVLAYPEKTFNVATVLFKTKQFILYDLTRMMSDQTAKSLYSIGYGLNHLNQMHINERIKTCDDKHRRLALEHLFLNCQFFKSDELTDEEADKRQKILWQILDDYYNELPDESEQTDSDKTWRMFLSRMDRRKMKPKLKETDKGVEIHFNPEIEPKLKEYSEKSLEIISEKTRFSALRLWATFRFNGDKKFEDYEQYENDPLNALQETKEIIEELKNNKDEEFRLFNHNIPAYVCSVLIRDFFEKLSDKDRSFCKDIIIELSAFFLNKEYRYQISDGTQPAITLLPNLMDLFPDEEETIKSVLLFCLFSDFGIDIGGDRYSGFAVTAIQNLWKNRYRDAKSLLLGYLVLKPQYESTIKRIREKNRKKGIFDLGIDEVRTVFVEENQKVLERILKNTIQIEDVTNFENSKLLIQETAFQLMPNGTDDDDLKKIAIIIISSFVKRLFSRDRDDRVEYSIKRNFLKKYAYFILSTKDTELENYLLPFKHNLNASESTADLFEEFIFAEDDLNNYNEFWIVWNFFKDKFIDLCKDGDRHWFVDKIIMSYLFASIPWNETAKEWHTLKNREKKFLKEVFLKIGHCPSALLAAGKLLNEIGSTFIEDGIGWISEMINENPELFDNPLKTNTRYYMENLLKKYIFENRERIKRNQR
jgi:hypothetical protein